MATWRAQRHSGCSRRAHCGVERPGSHQHGCRAGRAGGLVRARRQILVAALLGTDLACRALAGAGAGAAAGAGADYAMVTRGNAIEFPRDYGSHPEFRTEWWYVTGWLATQSAESLGFQITFFRTKPDIAPANPSAFAPRQMLIAHCAISDPKRGRLWQDQRIRRAGFGLAEAAAGDTHVWIDNWSLQRDATAYTAKIDAEEFSINLRLLETQAVLLNG